MCIKKRCPYQKITKFFVAKYVINDNEADFNVSRVKTILKSAFNPVNLYCYGDKFHNFKKDWQLTHTMILYIIEKLLE